MNRYILRTACGVRRTAYGDTYLTEKRTLYVVLRGPAQGQEHMEQRFCLT